MDPKCLYFSVHISAGTSTSATGSFMLASEKYSKPPASYNIALLASAGDISNPPHNIHAAVPATLWTLAIWAICPGFCRVTPAGH